MSSSSSNNNNTRNKNLLAAKHALGLASSTSVGSGRSTFTSNTLHTANTATNTVYTSNTGASSSTATANTGGRFTELKDGLDGITGGRRNNIGTTGSAASGRSTSTFGTTGTMGTSGTPMTSSTIPTLGTSSGNNNNNNNAGIFTLGPGTNRKYTSQSTAGSSTINTTSFHSTTAHSTTTTTSQSRHSYIHDLSVSARRHARRSSQESFSAERERILRERELRERELQLRERERELRQQQQQQQQQQRGDSNQDLLGMSTATGMSIKSGTTTSVAYSAHSKPSRVGGGISSAISASQMSEMDVDDGDDDDDDDLNSINNHNHNVSLNISNMNNSSAMNNNNSSRSSNNNSINIHQSGSSLNNVYEKKISFGENAELLAASTTNASLARSVSDADTFGDSSVALVSYSGREISNGLLIDDDEEDDGDDEDFLHERQQHGHEGNNVHEEHGGSILQDEMTMGETTMGELTMGETTTGENSRDYEDEYTELMEEGEVDDGDGTQSHFHSQQSYDDDGNNFDGEQSQQYSSSSYSQSMYSEQTSQQSSSYQSSNRKQDQMQHYYDDMQEYDDDDPSNLSNNHNASNPNNYMDNNNQHMNNPQSLASNSDTFSTFSSAASDSFVPQRFEEMRSLLLGITPLQLEALMMEIFGDDTPVGWKGIGQGGVVPNSGGMGGMSMRGKKRGDSNAKLFRKDAYLAEMSLQELMHFSHGMNLPGIESCETHDDAMDLIAIEFERLVSVHQNQGEDGNGGVSASSRGDGGDSEYSDGQSFQQQQQHFDEDAMSYISAGASNVEDEGENLRRSLRACSVPELRLVAERLQLDHSGCAHKEELILLIEGSMPGMAGKDDENGGSMQGSVTSSSRGDDSSSAYYQQQQQQQQQQRQMPGQQHRPPPPPPPPRPHPSQQQIQLYDHRQQQQLQPYQGEEDDSYSRNKKVSFAKDCKEDTSHLFERRDMANQATWQSFVVDGDVEHGDESESKNLMPNGDGDSGDDDGDDDWIDKTQSSSGNEASDKRKRLFGVFVLLCIIGLGVGLGLGLTKKNDGGTKGSNFIIPEGGYFNIPYQPTRKPTPAPSTVDELEQQEEKEIEPGEAGSNVAVVIVREPTSSSPTTISPSTTPTIAAEETDAPSLASVTTATLIPTENFGPIPMPLPTNVQTQTTNQPTNSPSTSADSKISPSPTQLSNEFPLLGPFDEVGMRMVFYGIGELSNMGRTQWHMLTAAYVEQFFNVEGQGVDAIQNIVFDVVCNIEISDQELLSASSEGAVGRALQGSSVILTFTMTISYRTFSSSLSSDAVAERPFFDEQMRADYVQFLSDNNAAQFVGDISGVSELFRGGDIPETPPEFLPSIQDTPSPARSSPTGSPTSGYVDSSTTANPTQTVVIESTSTESPTAKELTNSPTGNPTLTPTGKLNQLPTPKPTEYPTQNSFDVVFSTPPPSEATGSITTPPPTPTPSQATKLSTPYPTENALFGPTNPFTFPPTANKMFSYTPYPTVSSAPSVPTIPATISRPRPRPVPLTSTLVETPNPTFINTASHIFTENPTGIPTDKPSIEPTNEPTKLPTSKPTRLSRTRPPTAHPTKTPSINPTFTPPTNSPTIDCDLIQDPICPFLTETECCHPMCRWNDIARSCSFANENGDHEVDWMGEVEFGQTHVVKAKGETRHAPRLIAHREAELLFTPSTPDDVRRLNSKVSLIARRSLSSAVEERIESVANVYLSRGNGEAVPPNLERLAEHLIDGSGVVFSVPNYISDLDIILDLVSLRRINDISITLNEDTAFSDVKVGLRFDDGRNEDEDDIFDLPKAGWIWHDIGSHGECFENKISATFQSRQVRYIIIRLDGGHSKSSQSWGLRGIEITGYLDGLAETTSKESAVLTKTRAFSQSNSRFYTPSSSDFLRVAIYSAEGRLVGVLKNVRDPSKQRGILERKLSATEIDPYSETAWSVTIPHTWIEEGNIILIGCINKNRPLELLVHRLELTNLAQFSEHTVTRTKLAIFGDQNDVARLNHNTIEAKRLVRNLFSAMPVSELRWADTELWHLPYLVVMGPKGPALVNSEEERRTVTGKGEEISWQVMKNFLTIRHALAQSGFGLVETSEQGSNSPYASGTSVFMGWSLSMYDGDSWHWEDLGYWDTLAAAAWTGWCAMKAGDECSNYFIHEMGHAQSMQHFDQGTAENWGINDEYPNDGVMMSTHPWGYDSVSRRFRTWFDPLDGSGKKDPLNGEGEGPTSESCFSQYAPYQAQKSQEWAMITPILLSAAYSKVPSDGAYKFNPTTKQYVSLDGSAFRDAVGDAAMEPIHVGIPVATLVGTIGSNRDVCQTYPALRSRSGNVFRFPDPFSPDLSDQYIGAGHFVEVRFENGSKERALIASTNDLSDTTLHFFSFNIALDRRPIAVDLYKFINGSYPDITPETQTKLLHIRPIDLPIDDPLEGLPPLLRVGKGWLGTAPEITLSDLCVDEEDCYSETYTFEWRSDIGSSNVIYNSNLPLSDNNAAAAATVFKVPAFREGDSDEFIINVLATRFYNDELGLAPLLTSNPPSGEGSSDPDATHAVRIFAPYDMNKRLPPGIYRTQPGTLLISAKSTDGSQNLLDLDISINLSTLTESPTASPTKKPAAGTATESPTITAKFHIDWMYGTCVNDGKESSWSPPYPTKSECCSSHMGAEFEKCMTADGGSSWRL